MLVERRSLNVSLLLHVGLLLLAAFGLPVLLPEEPPPQPMVMTVDILPISEMTNVRPSDQPIQQAKAAPKPEPKTPEPPKPQPVEKAEPLPEDTFDPTKEAVPEKKEEKKEEKKPDDFEKLLNDLKKQADTPLEKKAEDKTNAQENKTISNAPYDETQPLSLSEEDALRSAYIPCWSAPAGSKDAEKLIVVVRAQYNPDGSLIDVKLDESLQSRYNSDVIFRAAADAGLRAVRHPRCNPLKNLPAALYPKLKDTKITFDPRLMLQ